MSTPGRTAGNPQTEEATLTGTGVSHRPDSTGAEIVSERFWTGSAQYPVCCVLVREPHTGLKAYIAGTDSAWKTRWQGTRVDPELGRFLFPAHASQKWAGW